jgi:hypothetical protein
LGIGYDDLYVRTEELVEVLNQWRKRHDVRHPKSDGFPISRKGGDRERVVGGFTSLQYLALYSGLGDRTIRDILNCLYEYTTLGKADKLLTAIEDSGALEDGRIARPVTHPMLVAKLTEGGPKPRRGQRKTRGVNKTRGAKT